MADQVVPGSRYELLAKIAAGGMATVYVGRVKGAAGFWRLVAIKRAHPHLIEETEFRSMLIDEAQVASRIHHTNVVSVLDVEESGGELLLVMDYVDGSSLSHLVKCARERDWPVPAAVAIRIVLDASAGLQAAHDLTDEDGTPLGVVHRDVSPHNILIGTDGVARLADFGIAKVLQRGAEGTASGVLKGKLSYMAPEYVTEHVIDARSDVFGMGIVAWELLTGKPLFRGKNEVDTLSRISNMKILPISEARSNIGSDFDRVVARALERDRDQRFPKAGVFATELEEVAKRAGLLGSNADVARFLKECLGPELEARRNLLRGSTQRASLPGEPEETTASMPDTSEVETRVESKSEPVTLSETPALPLVRASVPDVRPSVGVDATQPSFAHSQVHSSLRSDQQPTSRRWLWLGAAGVGVALIAAFGVSSLGSPRDSPLQGSAAPPAPVLEPLPSLSTPTPNASEHAGEGAVDGSGSIEPTPSPAPAPAPVVRKDRVRSLARDAGAPAPTPPVKSSWVPPENPYSK
jgi:serine/threonine-protein kinase